MPSGAWRRERVMVMTCEMCKRDKADAFNRMSPGVKATPWPGVFRIDVNGQKVGVVDPVLCSACCSLAPGREWMRAGVEADRLRGVA